MITSDTSIRRESRSSAGPRSRLSARVLGHFAASSRRGPHQVPHPDEVVRREREAKYPVDAALAAVPRLPQQGDGLQPAEDLFDALPLSLADHVAAVTSRSAVDRTLRGLRC